MAATTLRQFWTDEVARLTDRLDSQSVDVAAQRTSLTAMRDLRVAASDAVSDHRRAVDADRKALSAIPMPADGDALLVAMEADLIGLAEAQAAFAAAELAVQTQTAELARIEAILADLEAALADAKRQLDRENVESDARQRSMDALTSGALATLAADATAALAVFGPTARSRVETEFPSNTDDAKDFLKRARARRNIVRQSVDAADLVETAAFDADSSALDQARRAFGAAASAVLSLAQAAPSLESDRATLERLSELPAENPPASFPILSRSQHERLHDTVRQPARESALAKLADADDAVVVARVAQQAYDTALHDAMKADPDKTESELDAGPVATERAALDAKLSDAATKRAAITVAEHEEVMAWFAAVPDALWEALEQLDSAIARLTGVAGPPTPAVRVANLAAAETALVAEIDADRLARREQEAADTALQRAADLRAAERETSFLRSLAYAHSASLL